MRPKSHRLPRSEARSIRISPAVRVGKVVYVHLKALNRLVVPHDVSRVAVVDATAGNHQA